MSNYIDRPRQNLDRTHGISDPTEEIDRTQDPSDPPSVPAEFTLAQGVAHVVAQLTPFDIAYAKKTSKKECCDPFSTCMTSTMPTCSSPFAVASSTHPTSRKPTT